MLNDSEETVRVEAARALGNICDKRAVEPLIALLDKDSYAIVLPTIHALGKIGDSQAFEPLAKIIELNIYKYSHDTHFYAKMEALGWLRRIGGDEAVPLLESIRDNPNEKNWMRKAAAMGLTSPDYYALAMVMSG